MVLYEFWKKWCFFTLGVGLVLLRFIVMSVMFSGYVSDVFWIWSGLDDVKTFDAMSIVDDV